MEKEESGIGVRCDGRRSTIKIHKKPKVKSINVWKDE